ncbi:sugar phosphate isomerase/epimerase family protein [Paludibaculum fermentans]|uniref:Sugar phosphate isomerase/epimerase n=1 Tax=Paludibaculum fermentans TaxID=1473598 RepID=A0A7S7NTP6_PALFE|nr:sugar phosphate isomerase/epimerase [Paludibaculum fermentans]QOY89592.1 sugar phosphate isomerase/epimerase [Paludibaculum fermentans]
MMTRRELGKAALAAIPASTLLGAVNSKFGGVQIGAITYSFRALPSTAQDVLKYCVELGLSSIELMSDPAESFAGAPAPPQLPAGAGRQMTPERREALKQFEEERKKWRLSASMDKYKEFRKLYNAAGVKIDIFKLPLAETMSDDEYEYICTVAKTLGANCITMELPTKPEHSKRVGEFATRHKIYIGYHNHTHVDAHSWDAALSQSKYNSINLDVGHFTEAISASPIPFIKEHHDRITSFHFKDKKFGTKGGGNTPWGQGDTPLKEVLQLMKKEKYKWPANIELEYNVPANSSVMAEMKTCVKFCQDALA